MSKPFPWYSNPAYRWNHMTQYWKTGLLETSHCQRQLV